MKKLLSLVLAAVMLAGCTAGTESEKNNADDGYLYPMKDVILGYTEGRYDTTLTERALLSRFVTNETVANVRTAPLFSVSGDALCVLEVCDQSAVTGNVEDFNAYRAALRDNPVPQTVKIYPDGNPAAEPVPVTLEGTEDAPSSPRALYYDNSTGDIGFVERRHADGEITYALRQFAADGSLVNRTVLPFPDVAEMVGLYLYGDAVYYAPKERASQNRFVLYRYDIAEGTTAEIDSGIRQLCAQPDGIYYLSSAYNDSFEVVDTLFRLDPATGETGKYRAVTLDWDDMEQMTGMGWDERTGTLYLSSVSSVFAVNAGSGEKCRLLQCIDESTKCFGVYGTDLMLRAGNNMVGIYDLTVPAESLDADRITLNVCLDFGLVSSEEHFQMALDICRANGYNFTTCDVINTDNSTEYANTMAKKLMAGDTNFDIFFVDSDTQQLLEEKYYEDLSEYRLLDEAIDGMLPAVRPLCSIGERLSLIPREMYVSAAKYDPAQITGGFTAPVTFEDFVNLRSQVTLAEGGLYMASYSAELMSLELFREFITNFMHKTMDDETAKADLTRLYETFSALAADNAVRLVNGGFTLDCFVKFDSRIYSFAPETEYTTVFPLPKLGSTYKNSVDGSFYAINPNSPHKEEAAILLAAMMQQYRDRGLSLSGIYRSADDPETSRLYNALLTDGLRAWTIPTTELRGHLDEQFTMIAGGQTPAEAAENTFRYLKMIRDE